MGRRVGDPVQPCRAQHTECAIRILSIREKDNEVGPDFAGGTSEVFVKALTEPLVIKYETRACSMSVTLWIEFDQGNSVHAKFYGTYDGNGVIGTRLVTLVSDEGQAPGIHEATWDGRDVTTDHRILLEGSYKIRIQGSHAVILRDETTIKFAQPMTANFGIHYRDNTTKKEVERARDAQKSLSDGTAYSSDASCTDPALVAWGQLTSCAIGVVSGHSNPFLLAFYPEESTKAKAAKYDKKKASYILASRRPDPPPKDPKADIDNSVFLPEEPRTSLRDVMLIVLAGCRAGNEVLLAQLRLAQLAKDFDPGRIDGKHGPKTTNALRAWQKWEHIDPADGTKNVPTVQKLGIDPSLDERDQIRRLQTSLKDFSSRYDPGKVDSDWGPKTEAALLNYQHDHSPPLDETGLPDRGTIEHLRASELTSGEARNIAEAFVDMGCNISVAFVKKVSFQGAEKWHINFWDLASQGSGIDDAAAQARSMCGARHLKELQYSFYVRSGVDRNSTLHPARYGRDL